MRKAPGFTLIELLIVVAIIAILAAIAVPNFLEAQTRAKVSRVKADLRSLATAVESYSIDWNTYPNDSAAPQYRLEDIEELSTPVAYITNVNLQDPFNSQRGGIMGNQLRSYQYISCDESGDTGDPNWGDLVLSMLPPPALGARRMASLGSWGPDREASGFEWVSAGIEYVHSDSNGTFAGIDRIYDPTNGTISFGDVGRFVGDTQGLPQQF
jgi:type II secretion system protein G